jgi:hypothetical protein
MKRIEQCRDRKGAVANQKNRIQGLAWYLGGVESANWRPVR